MSNEVEVKYGDNAAGVASQLLAAASKLELHPSVVQTTSDGVFLAPEEVAEKAGLSYDMANVSGEEPAEVQEPVANDQGANESIEVPAGDLESRVAWVAEGEDESERTKRANAVHLHEVETGDLDEEALDQLGADLTVAVHGEAPPADDQADVKAEAAPATEELPIGKALKKALEDAGLPTSGNKAAQQARLAEHLSKKE